MSSPMAVFTVLKMLINLTFSPCHTFTTKTFRTRCFVYASDRDESSHTFIRAVRSQELLKEIFKTLIVIKEVCHSVCATYIFVLNQSEDTFTDVLYVLRLRSNN